MPCQDLYFYGEDAATAPPVPFWRNTAIQPAWPPVPTPEITAGVPVTISVELRNRGDDFAPLTSMDLFWSDPSTGFLVNESQRIGSQVLFPDAGAGNPDVPPESGPPPTHGSVFSNFAWTPSAAVAGTNGGHVCLLARARNEAPPADPGCAMQAYGPPAGISSDPLHAIRNIHVVAMGSKMAGFAFGAANNQPDPDTKLVIRPLDAKADRQSLEALVLDPTVDRLLAPRQLRFGTPSGVQVALGRERLRASTALKNQALARFARVGSVAQRQLDYMAAPGEKLAECKKGGIELDLHFGESQQILVKPEPCGKANQAYVVEVEHTTSKGRPIGGLTLIFVTGHDYFG